MGQLVRKHFVTSHDDLFLLPVYQLSERTFRLYTLRHEHRQQNTAHTCCVCAQELTPDVPTCKFHAAQVGRLLQGQS